MTEPSIEIYGTPGNQYGATMVGGSDVIAIDRMIANAFRDGAAGSGEPVVKIGTHKGRSVYEQKAADQVRISIADDGTAYVKLIARKADPGLGLLALSGGFKDAGETDQQTADREENEEARGKTGLLIAKHEIPRHPVPGDVRVWGGKDRSDGVKNGDIIAMSTMAQVPVVRNAHGVVEAGDDAAGAGWIPFSGLVDADLFGIKGHATMLVQAAKLAGIASQLPRTFSDSLRSRERNIIVGTPVQQQHAAAFFVRAATLPSLKEGNSDPFPLKHG